MIKSPLRYPGGKSRAVKHLSQFIPQFDEYREPFLGGGSLYVYLKQKYPDKKFWVNDLYENLYHFWKELQSNPNEVIQLINKWKNKYTDGRKLFDDILQSIDNQSNVEIAASFFVLNRITFSGTTESGGFSYSAFNGRFTESSIDRVEKLSSIIGDSDIITNYDFEDVIAKDGENVFIFIDPPYYSTSKLYGKRGGLHNHFDHERLSRILKNNEHKWMLTYDNHSYIRELYSFANINEFDLVYGMRNVNKKGEQKAKELLIKNF